MSSLNTVINELKKTTVPLMAAVAISNILYTALHSFYPIYLQDNFPQLKTFHFSVIIASFEVANLSTSLLLGLYMGKVKRKNLIIGSNILLLVSTLSFMTLPSFVNSEVIDGVQQPSNHYWFFYLSVFFRVLQGIASASI